MEVPASILVRAEPMSKIGKNMNTQDSLCVCVCVCVPQKDKY